MTESDRKFELPCAGQEEPCWLVQHEAELADSVQNIAGQLLSVCWTCPTFAVIRERAEGKRIADRVVLETLDRLVQRARERQDRSAHAWEPASILEEVSARIERRGDLDETLRLILTGITAGESLGFNRAFLFLVDENTQTLKGQMAVGPADAEEAGRLWQWISETRLTLMEMLQNRIDSGSRGDHILTEQVRNLEISLTHEHSVLARAVREHTTCHMTERPDGAVFPDLVGATHFVAVPLLSRGQAIGAIFADNRYSDHPITERHMHTLEALACLASVAIQSHRLSVELGRKVEELERAYENLREHQARLIESERIAAMGQLSAMIVHEIKGPLVSIGGLARLVKREIPPDHPHSEHLGIVADQVTRLEELIQDITDLSLSTQIRRTSVYLNKIVEQSMALVSKRLEESGVRTHLRLDAEVPAMSLDRNRIQQVLVNLFENALHAMSEGGTLSVYTRRTQAGIELEVRDTGEGIPTEISDRVFQPFFTTKPRGSGLGLAICRQIVERHGGRIEVARRNPGTGFIVRLPTQYA